MENRSKTDNTPFGAETASQLATLLAREGLELCHIGWRRGRNRGVLTLTIDREGGMGLDDCERASRTVDAFLDSVEELTAPYVLEVESPGLDRALWTLNDFRRFVGHRIRARLVQPVDGAANVKGILEGVDGDLVAILDEDQRHRYTVRFGDVKQARLVPDDENERTNRTPGRPESNG